MGGTQKSCCPRCNSSGSSNDTDNSRNSSEPSLGEVRSILEDGYNSLIEAKSEIAYGHGPAYSDAYQDALDSIPDDTRIGDIDELYTSEHGEDITVVLGYGDHPGKDDWIDQYADQLQDALAH
ncbi:MAG: hypothetical protein SVU32_08320 [Candidatus Nanohaloarchaea archaeon]|nr:hypothetical protein [Candidatus Nanohaloarchaea archaeon]